MAYSHRRALDDVSALSKVIQYLSDLNAFRDDTHMAAYRPYDVEGHTWEAFSFVANGHATTADEIFNLLAYRGFSRIDWQDSLNDLAERNWLQEQDGKYNVTDSGQAVRDEVEQKTDSYFYAPWNCLTTVEFDELCALLQQIREVV